MGHDGRGWSNFSAGQVGGAHTIDPVLIIHKVIYVYFKYYFLVEKKIKRRILFYFLNKTFQGCPGIT